MAQRTGVHANTISKWTIEGGWKKLQRNFVFTRQEQLARMMDELIGLNDTILQRPQGQRFADHKETLIRTNVVNAIATLEARVPAVKTRSKLTQNNM